MNKFIFIPVLAIMAGILLFNSKQKNAQESIVIRPELSKATPVSPATEQNNFRMQELETESLVLDLDLINRIQKEVEIDIIRQEIEKFENSFPVEIFIQKLNNGLASEKERKLFSTFLQMKHSAYQHLIDQEIYEMEELFL